MTGYRVKSDILVIWRLNVFFRKEKGPTFGLFYLFKNILQKPREAMTSLKFQVSSQLFKNGFYSILQFSKAW